MWPIKHQSFNKLRSTLFFWRVLAAFFSLGLVLCINPAFALADVKNSDEILGQSIESQGLTASECPSITAHYAYLVGADGTVYFSRESNQEVQIASVTKVMTALVACKYGDMQKTTIEVSKKAATVGESSAMLKAGDVMNLETALKCLMIVSGNDAALAIAESMGSDVGQALRDAGVEGVPENGYDAFIFAMNNTAQELGMNNTVFTNPHGLDDGNNAGDLHSSAHDVALMCNEAMTYDTIKSIVATPKTSVTVTRNNASTTLTLESTDVLLGNYEGACGIKTGFTNKAGACFAGACDRGSGLLYAIVLDSDSESQRFTDTETLFDWIYDNTISYPLIHSEITTTYTNNENQETTVPVVAEASHHDWLDKTFAATLADPQQTIDVFRLKGNVSQNVTFYDINGDVHIGDKVGTITFMQDNEELITVDMVAAEECDAPNFFEGIPIFWSRLFSGFSGQQTQAASSVVNTTPLIYGNDATV